MNPFRIGQSLAVQFGTRQRFTVAALRHDACLMRFPHSTAMSKWYSVADLRRWNPDTEPRAIIPAYIPVQFPPIVAGLRVRRAWCDPIAGPMDDDFTVLAVIRDVAFVRCNEPHMDGFITSRPLRTFWLHPGVWYTSTEPVALSGAELRSIAEQWRDLRAGTDTFWKRFNRALDKLTPEVIERRLVERHYAETRRRLHVALRRTG